MAFSDSTPNKFSGPLKRMDQANAAITESQWTETPKSGPAAKNGEAGSLASERRVPTRTTAAEVARLVNASSRTVWRMPKLCSKGATTHQKKTRLTTNENMPSGPVGWTSGKVIGCQSVCSPRLGESKSASTNQPAPSQFTAITSVT